MVAARISKTQLGLMTKVAKLYYEQSMKQPAIAERLGISQSRVSRLLTQALELGVVRIIVVTPDQVYADLEDALRTKVNAIIADAKKSGDIDKMAQKWLGRPAGQLPE